VVVHAAVAGDREVTFDGFAVDLDS
jgi:hypothetical protein